MARSSRLRLALHLGTGPWAVGKKPSRTSPASSSCQFQCVCSSCSLGGSAGVSPVSPPARGSPPARAGPRHSSPGRGGGGGGRCPLSLGLLGSCLDVGQGPGPCPARTAEGEGETCPGRDLARRKWHRGDSGHGNLEQSRRKAQLRHGERSTQRFKCLQFHFRELVVAVEKSLWRNPSCPSLETREVPDCHRQF